MITRWVPVLTLVGSLAGEPMPIAQQNALVKKYCTVCHTDAARNGGLSLERFDAAQVAPSLAAIMLSKLTSGATIENARQAASNPEAAAFVSRKRKAGAMNAAGIPQPDNATIDALIHAFAMQSRGAAEWTVERSKSSGLTASTLREMPSAKDANEAEVYRLIATCNPATFQGELQLAWSPVPQSGSLNASVDRKAPVKFQVKGSEKMGNGSGVILHGLAAVQLTGLPIPAVSLTITDLFPGETVTFSFATLPADARRDLNACFPASKSGT
jgi:hypothetical protein